MVRYLLIWGWSRLKWSLQILHGDAGGNLGLSRLLIIAIMLFRVNAGLGVEQDWWVGFEGYGSVGIVEEVGCWGLIGVSVSKFGASVSGRGVGCCGVLFVIFPCGSSLGVVECHVGLLGGGEMYGLFFGKDML